MYLVYNALMCVAFMACLPYFLLETIKTGKYKKGLPYKLGFSIPQDLILKPTTKSPIWIHALSVGEVNSAVPLVKSIHQRFKDIPMVFSATTETGYNVAQDRLSHMVNHIIFYPLDLIWIVRRIINTVRPRLFILVETDIWPNFLKVVRYYAPIILVNGSMSQKSYKRYRRIPWFTKEVLDHFSFLGVQTEEDASRFLGIGAKRERVRVMGNIKFDQPNIILSQDEVKRLKQQLGLKEERVFVAGSTHKGEDEIILNIYKLVKGGHQDIVLIIAPRHPERFDEVTNLAKEYGFRVVKRTKISPSAARDFDVIILDTIGELSQIYSLASVVFVGGSLVNIGGHNMLEVAAHKKVPLFGPYTHDQFEIVRTLKENDGGIEVRNEKELLYQVERLLDDPSLSNTLGQRAYEVINKNRGVLDRNMEVIEEFIKMTEISESKPP